MSSSKSIIHEIDRLKLVYKRHGGKQSRDKNVLIWYEFGEFCAKSGCPHLAEVGKRHVKAYLESKDLAPSTKYTYRLALEALFKAADLLPPPYLKTIHHTKPPRAEQRRRKTLRSWLKEAANDPIFSAEGSEPLPPDPPPHPWQY